MGEEGTYFFKLKGDGSMAGNKKIDGTVLRDLSEAVLSGFIRNVHIKIEFPVLLMPKRKLYD